MQGSSNQLCVWTSLFSPIGSLQALLRHRWVDDFLELMNGRRRINNFLTENKLNCIDSQAIRKQNVQCNLYKTTETLSRHLIG